MMHKLRTTMGYRDALYKLNHFVEADDAQFEVSKTKKETKDNKPGAKGKAKVAVQAQTAPPLDRRRSGKAKKGQFKFVKMHAIENIQAESLIPVISRSVNPAATVITDGGRGYITHRMPVAKHIKRAMKGAEATRHLPWVHIMILNAKL